MIDKRNHKEKRRDKRAYIVSGAVVVIAVALLALGSFAYFVLNPKADDNQTEIKGVGAAVHKVICAQAQIQANSYRIRQTDEHGHLEPVPHFITRMLAQRQLLTLATGLGCEDTPGFPPFEVQVMRALSEIRVILNQYRPEQRKATRDANPLLEDGPIPSVLFPAFPTPQVEAVEPDNGSGGNTKGTQPPKATGPTKKPAPAPVESAPVEPVPTHPEAVPAEDDQGENIGADNSPAPKTETLPGIVKEVVPPAACPLVDRAAKLCH